MRYASDKNATTDRRTVATSKPTTVVAADL
jgi:hypothetical protein